MSYFKFKISNFFKKYKIVGHSMEPTLRAGDKVLVSSFSYLFRSPHVGEIIAAKVDGKIYIKRITSVEKNTYFLRGDNPTDSHDSRKFGMIARKDIVGKVIYIK